MNNLKGTTQPTLTEQLDALMEKNKATGAILILETEDGCDFLIHNLDSDDVREYLCSAISSNEEETMKEEGFEFKD